jgi:uncharacterized protein YecE (DUF72 family)
MADRSSHLYVGTSGYSYPKWKGLFYPAELPAKGMLRFYAERFRAVEINSTYYALPKPETLTGWAADVPAGFRFALKAPQRITHIQRLRDSGEAMAGFLAAAGTLAGRLGPVLFGLPPNFKKDVPRLRAFLELLPAGCRAAVEFRHPSWFDDEVTGLLRDRQVALCVADADDELEVPRLSTAGWGYVRLRRAEYDDKALKSWAKWVGDQGWAETFVFFKHEDQGKGPRLASRFLELAG